MSFKTTVQYDDEAHKAISEVKDRLFLSYSELTFLGAHYVNKLVKEAKFIFETQGYIDAYVVIWRSKSKNGLRMVPMKLSVLKPYKNKRYLPVRIFKAKRTKLGFKFWALVTYSDTDKQNLVFYITKPKVDKTTLEILENLK